MTHTLKELASAFSKEMGCNCDLDNWEPEPSTGHSCVCRIHKAAHGAKRGAYRLPTALIQKGAADDR